MQKGKQLPYQEIAGKIKKKFLQGLNFPSIVMKVAKALMPSAFATCNTIYGELWLCTGKRFSRPCPSFMLNMIL